MKKINFILIILLWLISFQAFAAGGEEQEKKADSLRKVLLTEEVDSLRLSTLYTLSDIYWQDSLSLTLEYLIQAKEIAYQTKNPRFIARSLINLGALYQWNHAYERALEYYQQALEENDIEKNPKIHLEILQSISMCYRAAERYEGFLEYSQKGLKLAKEVQDTTYITDFYNSMGLALLNEEKTEEALEYLYKAYELTKLNPYTEGKNMSSVLLNNIGMAYNQLGDYEKAMKYIKESWELQKEILEQTKAGTLNYKEAKNKEVDVKYVINYLQTGIANSEINIGITYKYQGKNELALEYIKRGLNTSLKFNKHYQIRKGYMHLSEAYENLGDGVQALAYYKDFMAYKDSIQTVENSQLASQMESRIQAERAEKEVEQLQLENKIKAQRSRLINWSLMGGLFVTLAFGSVMFRRYREKQRLYLELEDKNHEISAQNHEIAAQNDQIVEKSEKLEAAYQDISEKNQHITDSINYAQHIQAAMLPTVATIQKALPESFVFFKPRDIVSGDFYWFSEKDNKIIFAAIDCTGHGVPGALMAMTGDAHLNQIVNIQGITDADAILNELHRMIRKSLKQEEGENKDGMDLALCVIDKQNKTVEFAGAKNPLVFIQNGEMQSIKGDKFAIGGYQNEEERKFQKHQLQLSEEHPTTFYMFSDGFQDQFGGKNGKKFMPSKLKSLLTDIHQKPFIEQEKYLSTTFQNWMEFEGKNYEQVDDVLVVGFQV